MNTPKVSKVSEQELLLMWNIGIHFPGDSGEDLAGLVTQGSHGYDIEPNQNQ